MENLNFVKTVEGGGADEFYVVRLKSERYSVEISYLSKGLKELREKNEVDFSEISVCLDCIGEPLPFKIDIDPRNIEQCRLQFTGPGIRYGHLDELKDAICEVKELIQIIMDVIYAEFGAPPVLTEEEVLWKKSIAREILADVYKSFRVQPVQTEENTCNEDKVFQAVLSELYKEFGLPQEQEE